MIKRIKSKERKGRRDIQSTVVSDPLMIVSFDVSGGLDPRVLIYFMDFTLSHPSRVATCSG